MPYYIGDLKRDPNLEKYPYDITLTIFFDIWGLGLQGSFVLRPAASLWASKSPGVDSANSEAPRSPLGL